MTKGSAVSSRAGPVSRQRRAHSLSSPRLAASWIAIGALAAAAWVITVMAAREMAEPAGTMGLAVLPFLGLWLAMMAAMMLPSVAPVAVLWARLIGSVAVTPVRVARMTLFLSGYLLTWVCFGAIAFAALTGTGRLFAASPMAAKWVGVVLLVGAGTYQLTPWKDRCLRLCRSPIGGLVHYIHFQGRIRDLRVGIHHGASCVGCCSGLMIVLVAVGVMNIPAMAGIALVVLTEKLWRHGRSFGLGIGLLLAVTGLVAIWFPWLLPGVWRERG